MVYSEIKTRNVVNHKSNKCISDISRADLRKADALD